MPLSPSREVDTIIRSTSADYTKITLIMNIGAMLVAPYAAPHNTKNHISDRYDHQDKLTQETLEKF